MRDSEWIVLKAGRRARVPGGHFHRDWVRLLRRQEDRCAGPLCGRSFDEYHPYKCLLTPASRGGTANIGNLVALCFDCMTTKHDRTWIEFRVRRQRHADLLAAGPQTQGTGRPSQTYHRMKGLARSLGYL